MAQGDSPRAKLEKERDHRLPKAVDNDNITERDATLIREFLDALDENELNTTPPSEIGTKTASTLRSYSKNIRLVAKAADAPLAELTADDLNALMGEWRQSLSDNTVQQRQSAARVFYRFHDDMGVDPENITLVPNDPSPVDSRDPFDREELDAIRAEFSNNRDRAMFDLMLYTGQRIRAIQTLRVGDVDLAEQRFYLNTDAAGLKGAKGMRPLLQARGSVADWLEDHPASDDKDAYLISPLPDAARGDAYTPVHQTTISRRIRSAGEAAGINRWEERCHPHNLRHSFVRWAYIEKDMDVQTIKYMGGWSSDSQTFERTYFNILDEEHAQKAEAAAGVREERDDRAPDLGPEVCPVCDASLRADAKACPRCGTLLTPDAQDAQQEVQQDIGAAKALADVDASELSQEEIKAIADNDEILARLIELRSES